ncbi:MAG: DNA-binding domain-containing protein [Paracoccaceae bacterium]|nr:DNA-binding domain-containing protein [Paracoccaceae bacterium]MDG1737474.1 DNA-binding domain-containing protein [Paracoccaceae bacterium]MDG2257916.1 DNA-binding domain-containing protein [Paracoccaceae bacterium]
MIVDQTAFHAALRNPSADIPTGLTNDKGAPAGSRFNVYRNNVTTSLMDALSDGFPVIHKLLGQENFKNLARDYQAAHPPSSPLMMMFGAEFPDFLRTHPGLAKLAYLGDVAEMEYAMRRSYHAANSVAIDPAVLASLDETSLLASTFQIAPSVQVCTSAWPILGIWRFNSIVGAPKPTPKAECVLITRPDFDPSPEEITKGDVALLQSFANGETLETALIAAQTIEEGHDFGRILQCLLAGGAITKIDTKG